MEILAILETLEDIIEKSIALPFSGKSLIDKEEILEIVKEIRLKLPDDIKQAKWVKEERQRILLEGDVPSPINPSPGCRFKGRCRYVKDICHKEMPPLKEVAPDHYVACHIV
jgi:oligopeptide/dipeptide ABC transporter ATP-binding protein